MITFLIQFAFFLQQQQLKPGYLQQDCILYYIVKLENAWNSTEIDRAPHEGNNRYWAIFYYLFFFFGNICMLNMFIGLIVQAYDKGKLEAQNLHLLEENQREWFKIKISIYKMKPLVKSIYPSEGIKKHLFLLIKDKRFKVFWLCIIFLNTFVLAINYHRQSESYQAVLDILNTVFISIFIFEIILRLLLKDFKIYFSDNMNRIDLLGVIIFISSLIILKAADISFFTRRIIWTLSVIFQLLRNFRIIKRFNTIEKLFNTIFSVIPSALGMMYIMFIFLFIYTNLGMDMFAYLRPQSFVNGFDLHYQKFTTAMFSLVRVASLEQWWALLVDCARTKSPDFHCIEIDNYNDFMEYGFNGCGTKNAYIFYISFHLIFSLMILNLFIASVLGAYDEHVKDEESAISKYQLHDVLNLWSKYDPRGLGFINYKLFWKLSSEIAIIFGVDQSDLLDVNNKKNFLKVLNIPIYENIDGGMLCYKFHEVILSLTRISVTLKYGVANLDPTEKDIIAKLNQTFGKIFNQQQTDKFKVTEFNSGDMASIIYIQKKIRGWIKRVVRKDQNAIGEMSDFKNVLNIGGR